MTDQTGPEKKRKVKRNAAQVIVGRIARMRSNVDRLKRQVEKAQGRHDKASQQLQIVLAAAGAKPVDVALPLEEARL